jgi:hypothetical protein
LSACLKDEGNYDYLDLNQVVKISGIDEFYSMYKFEDVLQITPEITFKHDDESNYEYEWSLNYWILEDGERNNYEVIISTDKNLEFVADHTIPYDEFFAVLKVRNTVTKVEYKHDFKVRVQNAYEYGYFFLCEKGADGELFLVKENGGTIPDLHAMLTGNPISGKPLQMESTSRGADLVIFADAAPNYGSVFDFKKLEYKWGAIKCFHDELVQEPFTVNAFTVGVQGYHDIYTIVNNHYYYTAGMVVGDYKPYVSLDVPDIEEPADYAAETAFGVSFVHCTDPGTVWAPGSWGAIDVVMHEGEELVMPGSCLFMGAEPGGSPYGTGVNTHFFILDDGVVMEYILNSRMDFSVWKNVHSLTVQREFVNSDLISSESKIVNSNSERYFYFSSENKIYRYNYDAPEDAPALIAELPAGQTISYLYLDYTQEGWTKYDDKFVVATYDDSGANNGSIYFVNLDGTIDSQHEHVCGKIVDLVVKK